MALLDAKEVQERLGISESTLFRILKRRELTGFKVGRVWKFEERDIEEFIRRRREEQQRQAEQNQTECFA